MSAQHTPGPWDLSSADDAYNNSYHGDKCAAVLAPDSDGGSWIVAEVCGDVGDRMNTSEGMANAHLIAAAPDLLAALKQAVAEAASATNPGARLPNYEQACAAIAKAESR